MTRFICAALISISAAAMVAAQSRIPDPQPRIPDPQPRIPDPQPRIPDPEPRIPDPGSRIPDLSGTWSTFPGVNASAGLRRASGGAEEVRRLDRANIRGVTTEVPGVQPWTDAPSYKPEHLAKVKELDSLQSKTDPVFYCAKPGVPRVGPPRRIVQLPNEIIFFYEDMSGDPYRLIPTDGRPHRANANPSYYGDSVGRWEGNVLVIDVRNFVEDTWFGEKGYFHTDAMRVTERLWKSGENLVWQATVEDPNVLTRAWTMPPRIIRPSDVPLEESPACREQDAPLLRNNDHHDQR